MFAPVFARLKDLMPRGLYGRAALILILPIVAIQLVVSSAFIQRHFEDVTRQMTMGVAIEIRQVLSGMAAARDPAEAAARAAELAAALEMTATLPAALPVPETDLRRIWDLSGRVVIGTLRERVPAVERADLVANPREVRLWIAAPQGMLGLTVDRRRVSASNPHQLLVLMIFTSILMTLIAVLFLRNQIRPIRQLGRAAEAFGKGKHIAYRPRGASEVRAAGTAFLDMRARIERQMEQRTLMLSGVSHDLRTPLTRLRLGLSLLPEDAETAALLRDVADMERLVDEFLSFARGDAMEDSELVDPVALVTRVVEDAQRMAQPVTMRPPEGQGMVQVRPAAVRRALENLIGNAVRHGSRAEVGVVLTDRALRLTVEDDGPGIPKDRRDEAMAPFTRLDEARDPNRGGGAGLGLSIAADIARSHGGSLRLGESEALGGLKAELVLAR